MKTYLWATGGLFGLLTIVHIWRMIVEPSARDPWFVLITLISALLTGWAIRLLRSA
jgi:hypothetical protein